MFSRGWMAAACAVALFATESGAFAPAGIPGLALRHGFSRNGIVGREVSDVSVSMCEPASGGEGSANKSRAEEIEEVLGELEQFRERIVDNFKGMGQKVKAKPKEIKKQLATHPDVNYIDKAKEQLLAELEELKKMK